MPACVSRARLTSEAIGLGSPEAATQFAVVLTGDFMYTRYFNSLFVITRSAVYGTVGFEAEFE